MTAERVFVVAPTYAAANLWGRTFDVPRAQMVILTQRWQLGMLEGSTVALAWPGGHVDRTGVLPDLLDLVSRGFLYLDPRTT